MVHSARIYDEVEVGIIYYLASKGRLTRLNLINGEPSRRDSRTNPHPVITANTNNTKINYFMLQGTGWHVARWRHELN